MSVLSIIINNYNYARFLPQAIDSALGQTRRDAVEVIVVDDGSTDNSRAILESYGPTVRRIFKKNGGQASALNAGFAKSSGALVLFLDADDALSPEAADTLLSAWHDGVVRIQFPLDVIDALGNPVGRQVGGSTVPSATLGPFGVDSPTSGNAFSKAVLQGIMPIPESDWQICADGFLTAASSLFGEVVSLSRPLGRYRVHGKNMIAGAPEDVAQIRRAIVCDFNLHRSLRALAPDQIGSLEKWLSRYPQHWVSRISSLRESPANHPWDDRLFELTRRAVSATWRQPYWNLRRKLVYSVWVVGYSISPKRIAQALKRIEGRGRKGLPGLLLGR